MLRRPPRSNTPDPLFPTPPLSPPMRAASTAPPQRCSATLARPAFPPPPRSVPGHFAPLLRGRNMTSFRAILLALLASVLVTGCNTVKGAGRDIESVGQAGSDAID